MSTNPERQNGSQRRKPDELAILRRLARNYYDYVPEFCNARRSEGVEKGFLVLCNLGDEHDGDHLFIEDDILGVLRPSDPPDGSEGISGPREVSG